MNKDNLKDENKNMKHLMIELLEMFDANGRFITGVYPAAFVTWLKKARSLMSACNS